jgi:hypothetical protein
MLNYKLLLLSALVVFLPLKPVLVVVAVLVAASHVSGLLAARKQGKAILPLLESKKALVKLIAYVLIVGLAFLTEQYLTGDLVPLVKVLAGGIGMSELRVCLESLETLTGAPLLTSLINKLAAVNDQPPPPGA